MQNHMQCRLRIFVALVVLVPAACGGTTTNGGNSNAQGALPKGVPVSQEELPSTAARDVCTRFAPCCSQAKVPFDVAACEKRLVSQFESQLALDPYGTYDPAAGGRCVAYMEHVASTCGVPPVDPSTRFRNDSICLHDFFVGKAPPGAPCAYGNDCAQPASCDPLQPANADGSFSHLCVARPHGKEGDDCVGDCTITQGSAPYECSPTPGPPGAYCYLEDDLHCASDGTCHADGPGAACSADSPCNDTAFCNAKNVCQALGADGAECSDSSQCLHGFYCDAAATRCKQRLPPFSACSTDEQCAGDPKRCVDGHCAFQFAYVCTGEAAPSAN
jgi:hypothetical protein